MYSIWRMYECRLLGRSVARFGPPSSPTTHCLTKTHSTFQFPARYCWLLLLPKLCVRFRCACNVNGTATDTSGDERAQKRTAIVFNVTIMFLWFVSTAAAVAAVAVVIVVVDNVVECRLVRCLFFIRSLALGLVFDLLWLCVLFDVVTFIGDVIIIIILQWFSMCSMLMLQPSSFANATRIVHIVQRI